MAAEKVKKNDIRWQRTERYLMEAFGEALNNQSLEKIKVTELARQAEINKATFYLHYHDVYDLAEAYARAQAAKMVDGMQYVGAFFTEPRKFVNELINALDNANNQTNLELLARNHLLPHFMDELSNKLNERFHSIKPVPDDAESRIVVTFFLSGALGALGQNRNAGRSNLVNVLTGLLEAMTERGRKLDEIQAHMRRYSGTQSTKQGAKATQGVQGAQAEKKLGKASTTDPNRPKVPLRERPNRNSADYWIELANRKLQ